MREFDLRPLKKYGILAATAPDTVDSLKTIVADLVEPSYSALRETWFVYLRVRNVIMLCGDEIADIAVYYMLHDFKGYIEANRITAVQEDTLLGFERRATVRGSMRDYLYFVADEAKLGRDRLKQAFRLH